MRKPVARPTGATPSSGPETETPPRSPRAFAAPPSEEPITDLVDFELEDDLVTPAPRRRNWLWRAVLTTGGILVSLGLGLAADRLIADLFATYEWLGWLGLTVLGLFVLALLALVIREIAALRRLTKLDHLRERAADVLDTDDAVAGKAVMHEVLALYEQRPDLARAHTELSTLDTEFFDGAERIAACERMLMMPLDARARALISASSKRVAIVTAISPRALVDLAFVTWESAKLARAIAGLYGARPGLFGSWRLAGEILGHLAVTGTVAVGDSVVQQLVGHGVAAKVSARLGEGVVNGLMTVRIGIAAMRVTRPLPFSALTQPSVTDFMADLAKLRRSDGSALDRLDRP